MNELKKLKVDNRKESIFIIKTNKDLSWEELCFHFKRIFSSNYGRKYFIELWSNEDLCPHIISLYLKDGFYVEDLIYHLINNEIPYKSFCSYCGDRVHVNVKYIKYGYPDRCSKFSCKQLASSLRMKRTSERLGVKNISQVKEIHEKQVKSIKIAHNERKEEIETKRKKTFLNKYGLEVSSPMLVPELKERWVKSNKDWLSNEDNVRNKIEKTKETCQRLYGVDFATQKESSIKANKDAAKKRSWDKMINICKTLDVEPAFTFDDWHGYGFDKQYPWKCLTCGEIFYHNFNYKWYPKHSSCHPVTTSLPQKEIIEFIKNDLGVEDVLVNDRKTLKTGKEIDIFIKSLNSGIEFNGTYYHSSRINRDENYHQDKVISASDANVKMLNVFERDWIYNNDKVKLQIRNFLSSVKTDENFTIDKLLKSEVIDFINNFVVSVININNISNKCFYGVFNSGELIAIFSFDNETIEDFYSIENIYTVFDFIENNIKYKYIKTDLVDSSLFFYLKSKKYNILEISAPDSFYEKNNKIYFDLNKNIIKSECGEKFNPSVSLEDNILSFAKFYKTNNCGFAKFENGMIYGTDLLPRK